MHMTKITDEAGDGREREQVDRSTGRILFTDQIARDDAKDANNRIESHEKFCTERWKHQSEGMVRLENAIGGIQKAVDDRIGKLPAGIIAALTGVCGYLAARAFPIH